MAGKSTGQYRLIVQRLVIVEQGVRGHPVGVVEGNQIRSAHVLVDAPRYYVGWRAGHPVVGVLDAQRLRRWVLLPGLGVVKLGECGVAYRRAGVVVIGVRDVPVGRQCQVKGEQLAQCSTEAVAGDEEPVDWLRGCVVLAEKIEKLFL